MTTTGIQGQLLDITVVGCNKLRDTEWISRQDPYVCLEYASTKFRTRTCTDGGKNPSFNEKFVLPLIEGLHEINVLVWNSNTITFDDIIGTGKVRLQKVLSSGYDDTAWALQSRRGKAAGEVKLILHYANASKNKVQSAPSAPPYPGQSPAVAAYAPPSGWPQYQQPSSSYPGYPSMSTYQPPLTNAYPPPPTNVPLTNAYPPPPTNAYPPSPAYYPPPPAPYPPSPYGSSIAPSAYPPVAYPPPGPQGSYSTPPYPGYYHPGTHPPR